MNYLQKITQLNNRYFVMRHGQSKANRAGIIVSDPAHGINDYGLSSEGREQVKSRVASQNQLNSHTLIYCSDFKRAYETALLVSQLLNCDESPVPDARLRERNFGDFELTPDSNYQIVWNNDGEDGAQTKNNVESADAVMQRVTEFVIFLEQLFVNQPLLLVAHGDTLQILQAAFQKQSASRQRALKHLETAEIRNLILANGGRDGAL